jgi:hypothetical protein
MYGPRNCNNLDNKAILEKSPIREENIEFPLDGMGDILHRLITLEI